MTQSRMLQLPAQSVPARLRTRSLRIAVWIVILFAIVVVSLWNYDSFEMGAWVDDATYIGLARALWQPDSYQWLAANTDNGALSFPPGYPLLLAPLVALFPDGFLIPRLTSLLLTLICATLLYWGWSWFVPGSSERWAVAVTILYGVSSLTIEHTRMVMSEPLFMLLTLLTLLVTERAARDRLRIGQAAILGVLLVSALLVRSVGIILIVAILTYLLFRQGRHAIGGVMVMLASMAAIVALMLWMTPVEFNDLVPNRYLWGNSTFLDTARDTLNGSATETLSEPGSDKIEGQTSISDRIRRLAQEYLVLGVVQRFGKDLRTLVFPLGGSQREAQLAASMGVPWLPRLIGFLVSAVVWLGFAIVFVQKRGSAFIFFGVVYLAITVLWVSSGRRLFYPIMPQLYYAFLFGIDTTLRALATLSARWAPGFSAVRMPLLAAIAILLVLLSIRQSLTLPDTRNHIGNIAARSNWLAENASPDEIIMTEQPVVDFVYSQRKTLWYPGGCPEASRLATYLNDGAIDYVLVAPRWWWSPQYDPAYSDVAQCVLVALEALSKENRAELAYASEVDHIQVFRVNHD